MTSTFCSRVVLAVVALFFFAILNPAAAIVNEASGTYEIDPVHSKVGFEVSNLVISSVEGKFNSFEGKVILAPEFKKSSVKVTVKVDSIDTDVKKRDDHLKSADFFDVVKYPTMIYETSDIAGTREKFVINGKLTLHGVTKPVKLYGKFQGIVKDVQGKERAAFTATAKISRKLFGLTWNDTVEAGPVVGDEISIDLKIQAVKVAADEKK